MSHETDNRRTHLIGMACIATAAMLFPVKDSFMKMQDERVPILLAVGLYFFIQACIAFIVITFKERRLYGNPFAGMKWLNLVRSLALALSMGLFFAGLRHVPIAVAFALFTIQGLFIVVLGYFILGEALRLRHIMLIIMAICGVMFIIRPTELDATFLGSLYPLAAAVMFSLYIVLTRKLGKTQPPIYLLLQDGLVASSLMVSLYGATLAIYQQSVPTVIWNAQIFIMPPAVAALIGSISSLLMIQAARLAPVAKLVPLTYLEFASAALIGVYIFAEILDVFTMIGIAIIMTACITNAMMNKSDEACP
ncbi:DMT family transporter [uncultured Candidatus Puniceispirillum sp.]|uniref:DMT family transporter n=1 Tax=uncultured Candidatus Puniceispirillum sp. TaxID=1985115 RepID=UPI0032B24EC0